MNYKDLYRDPRWQKLRLEVMNRAGFQCEECSSEQNTLNVHHKFYTKGAKPWEYEPENLQCLCENCHSIKHAILEEINACIEDMKIKELCEIWGHSYLISRRNEMIKNDLDDINVGFLNREHLQGYISNLHVNNIVSVEKISKEIDCDRTTFKEILDVIEKIK